MSEGELVLRSVIAGHGAFLIFLWPRFIPLLFYFVATTRGISLYGALSRKQSNCKDVLLHAQETQYTAQTQYTVHHLDMHPPPAACTRAGLHRDVTMGRTGNRRWGPNIVFTLHLAAELAICAHHLLCRSTPFSERPHMRKHCPLDFISTICAVRISELMLKQTTNHIYTPCAMSSFCVPSQVLPSRCLFGGALSLAFNESFENVE